MTRRGGAVRRAAAAGLRPRLTAAALACGAAVWFAVLAPGANAAIFTVTSVADAGPNTLREAIGRANDESNNPGHDIVQITATGTIDLASPLPNLAAPITIDGPGADALTIRRPVALPSQFRIFYVPPASSATIEGVTIRGGYATGTPSNAGGGGILSFGPLTVASSTVTQNTANGSNSAQGGGIYTAGGPLTITDSTISANTVISGNLAVGAGVNAFSDAPLTMQRTAVLDNVGVSAIQVSATTTIENSTVHGNGGGIGMLGVGGAQLNIRSSTVTANGGRNVNVYNPNVSARLDNSILADVLGGLNCGAVGGATIVSLGHNISDDGSCQLQAGMGDLANVDPVLAPIADNGGPTQTQAIDAASPAHDAGVSAGLATDQRGLARPYDDPADANAEGGDGSDIGAFELRPPGEPPPGLRCKKNPVTIAGTDGRDKLRGTGKADVIAGLGDDDRILGRGGKDLICGGDGNDLLKGGGGKDSLLGEGGRDKLRGGDGRDKLRGGPGKDDERQ